MLGSLAALLVGLWFYYTAPRSGKSSISWGVSGVTAYFITALIWTLAVTPVIKDVASHSHSSMLIFLVRYAYIFVGVVSAVLLNFFLNKSYGAA